ncbi:MAG: hypothetical protein AAF191_20495, partial [Verrucomicrobiota bacterium]
WIMNPGDTVYLFAAATSRAYGPNSIADGSSTLTMSFGGPNGSNGLTALSTTPIPEPSAFTLALLAMIPLVSRRRR